MGRLGPQPGQSDNSSAKARDGVEDIGNYRPKSIAYPQTCTGECLPAHRHFADRITRVTKADPDYYIRRDERKPELLKKDVRGKVGGFGSSHYHNFSRLLAVLALSTQE